MDSSKANPASRRKFPRRDFPRGIGVLLGGVYSVQPGFEIGEGGISFLFPEAIAEDRMAVANFQIPGGGFASVIIDIRRCFVHDETGMTVVGCSFRDVTFEMKREIRTFVSARS
jgi:hypothetical protein